MGRGDCRHGWIPSGDKGDHRGILSQRLAAPKVRRAFCFQPCTTSVGRRGDDGVAVGRRLRHAGSGQNGRSVTDPGRNDDRPARVFRIAGSGWRRVADKHWRVHAADDWRADRRFGGRFRRAGLDTGARRSGRQTRPQPAAAMRASSNRPRLSHRLTGISRVLVPQLLATLTVPVGLCFALPAYGINWNRTLVVRAVGADGVRPRGLRGPGTDIFRLAAASRGRARSLDAVGTTAAGVAVVVQANQCAPPPHAVRDLDRHVATRSVQLCAPYGTPAAMRSLRFGMAGVATLAQDPAPHLRQRSRSGSMAPWRLLLVGEAGPQRLNSGADRVGSHRHHRDKRRCVRQPPHADALHVRVPCLSAPAAALRPDCERVRGFEIDACSCPP